MSYFVELPAKAVQIRRAIGKNCLGHQQRKCQNHKQWVPVEQPARNSIHITRPYIVLKSLRQFSSEKAAAARWTCAYLPVSLAPSGSLVGLMLKP